MDHQNPPYPPSTRPSLFAAPPPFRAYGSTSGPQDGRSTHPYDPLQRREADVGRTPTTTSSYAYPTSYATSYGAEARSQPRPLSPVRYGTARGDTNGYGSSHSPVKPDIGGSKEFIYREGKNI
jgi:hypothetical protein